MDTLRTLLIIILVLVMLRLLVRILFPYLMRYLSKKLQQRFQQQFEGHFNQQPPESEGQVKVDSQKAPNKASSKVVGDYIDFEEID